MPRTNMPTGKEALNGVDGRVSYVVLTGRRNDFPLVANLGIHSPVLDINNAGLSFTATIAARVSARRVAVKLVTINPAHRGIIPLDGILSITLIDNTKPTMPVDLPVADVSVDYIND